MISYDTAKHLVVALESLLKMGWDGQRSSLTIPGIDGDTVVVYIDHNERVKLSDGFRFESFFTLSDILISAYQNDQNKTDIELPEFSFNQMIPLDLFKVCAK